MSKRIDPEGKPVAVFDIDGTIYRSLMLFEMIMELFRMGVFTGNEVSNIDTHKSIWQKQRDRESYWEYVGALIKVYLNNIKGVRKKDIESAVETILRRYPQNIYVWTRNYINLLKYTHYLIAISGAPEDIVGPFSKRLGMQDFRGAKYEVKRGVYTGGAQDAIKNKSALLENIVDELKLSLHGSVGVGDTDFDIPMLEIVEIPIAFNPNKELMEYANERRWRVIIEQKDMFYELPTRKAKFTRIGKFLQCSWE